ncbi:MAG: restriction endonuclease subunit S [Fimbriimonadaceae bacterium]|nr:restriction endonuclease subunit S [Fimbriimonadaceae bacterium]
MKYLVDERVEKGYPDEPLLTASQSHGVIAKSDYGSRTVEAQKDLHLLKLVEPGDYVISLRSFQGGIEYAHVRGIISPAYTVLEPKPEIRRGYYEHFFKSADFISSMTLFVTGIREGQNIDYVRLSRAYMPVPPPEEQDAIGRFIRHLDQRVNRLIKTKRLLIELLNEQKQAIIHRAVTRGLDPTVPLKPSGIDWLGDIPSNWQTHELRRLAKFVSGGTPSKAEPSYWIGEIPWVSPKDMKKPVIGDAIDHISEEGRASSGLTLLPVGTMLIVVRGMILIRTVPVAITSAPVTINQDMKGLLVDQSRVLPEFLYIVMRAAEPAISSMVEMSGHGTRKLVTERLQRLKLPVPDLKVQAAMVSGITSDTHAVDAAIGKAQSEIDFIREYRTRLVADVVTGQLDVRHLDLPEVEESLIEAIDAVDGDELDESVEGEESD